MGKADQGAHTMRTMRAAVAVLAIVAGLVVVPAGVAEAHEGNFPVVLIPGWHGNASTFEEMIPALQAQGLTVLDFDPDAAGTQAMSYGPSSSGQHIPYLAGKVGEERIRDALSRAGYNADTQKVDIVAHSMGGLVARFLIEQPGADVDFWSDTTGWYGDGVNDVNPGWAARIDDLVMLGTPSHGTWEAWVPGTIGGFGLWNESGGDMAPRSVFLERMGYAEPAGETYSAMGGDPAYLRWLLYDYDGDGVRHGFDGVVPAESPYVTGADMWIVPRHHGELVASNDTLDLIIGALGYVSVVDLPGAADLAGTASVRLEFADIVQDHDWGSTDEVRFDVHVDPDGNNDGYTYLNTIAYDRDGPFTQDWGNGGPASAAIALPGTSPRIDVKLVVWEDDCCGAREPVSTVYFTDLLLSDDLDGMDYYQARAGDAAGGTNTFRISINGATSQVGKTRLVGFGFDKALVQKTLESWGKSEAQFTLHAGRDGFAGEYYRGSPTDGSHYERSANTWADIGSHANSKGVVEPEIVWQGRMLNSATWRFDAEYFDDDGGWSNRDSGGRYQWTGEVSALAAGRTNRSGTSLAEWDAYWYVEVKG